MKKILLASTAMIVGFAGAAAAEISLSGYAEIGVSGGDDDTTFHTDLDLTLNFSGMSDNGLEFGATIDLDEIGDDCASVTLTTTLSTINGGSITAVCTGGDPIGAFSGDEQSIYVSGAFGKITMGDTDGALDWAVPEIYLGTSLNDDHSTHAGAYWNTGLDGIYDGQVARYEYSFGDWAVAASAEIDDAGDGDPAWGIGFKWGGNFGGSDIAAGIGYQTVSSAGFFDSGVAGTADADVWAIGASATFGGGFSASAGYADYSIDDTLGTFSDFDWWGVGVGYSANNLIVQVNYGEYGGEVDQSGWGLVANYDLGGGAVAMFGYGGSSDGESFNGFGEDTWSAGLGLSF